MSVLFMTQITELKMLLDVRNVHRFYEVVLALLIASIVLQIFLGMIIIYMGHLRLAGGRGSVVQRLLECIQCKCKPLCCGQGKKRAQRMYMNVPVDDGTMTRQEVPLPLPEVATSFISDYQEEEFTGCCAWPERSRQGDALDEDIASNSAEMANVRMGNAMARILRAANEVERLEADLKKVPRDQVLEDELKRGKEEIAEARKDKEEAQVEGRVAESKRQQAILATEHRDEIQEKKVFQKLTYWQQLALYLLYFIGLMNVFITAFGISGSKNN